MSVIDRDSLIGMVAGPLVWAAHFLFCYVLVSVACAFGFASAAGGGWGTVPILLVIASVLALASIAGLALLAYRRGGEAGGSRRPEDAEAARHRFMSLTAMLLGVLSAIGVVYTSVPLFVLPPC